MVEFCGPDALLDDFLRRVAERPAQYRLAVRTMRMDVAAAVGGKRGVG